jgi:hypothetical protein
MWLLSSLTGIEGDFQVLKKKWKKKGQISLYESQEETRTDALGSLAGFVVGIPGMRLTVTRLEQPKSPSLSKPCLILARTLS